MSWSMKSVDFCSEPMENKPVSALPGVGPVTEDRLNAMGYHKASDVYKLLQRMNYDEDSFCSWMKRNFRGCRASDCYNALMRWHRQFGYTNPRRNNSSEPQRTQRPSTSNSNNNNNNEDLRISNLLQRNVNPLLRPTISTNRTGQDVRSPIERAFDSHEMRQTPSSSNRQWRHPMTFEEYILGPLDSVDLFGNTNPRTFERLDEAPRITSARLAQTSRVPEQVVRSPTVSQPSAQIPRTLQQLVQNVRTPEQLPQQSVQSTRESQLPLRTPEQVIQPLRMNQQTVQPQRRNEQTLPILRAPVLQLTQTAVTSEQSGQNPIPSLQSGQNPIPSLQSGQNPIPSLQSSQNPITSLQSGQNPIPSLQSSQNPITSLQSGQNPIPSLQSSQNPITSLQSGQNPITSLQSSQNPITSLQSGQNPITSLQSSQNPITSLQSGQNSRTSQQRGITNAASNDVLELDPLSTFFLAMEGTVKKLQSSSKTVSTTTTSRQESIEAFFETMQATIRTFQPESVLEVKSQIFKIISDYEHHCLQTRADPVASTSQRAITQS